MNYVYFAESYDHLGREELLRVYSNPIDAVNWLKRHAKDQFDDLSIGWTVEADDHVDTLTYFRVRNRHNEIVEVYGARRVAVHGTPLGALASAAE